MYVASWPKPGMLKLLSGPQVADGPEPVPAGADGWQAKRNDFLVMSFKPDLVREVLPQLAMVPAQRPAHGRYGDEGHSEVIRRGLALLALLPQQNRRAQRRSDPSPSLSWGRRGPGGNRASLPARPVHV